MHVYEQVFCVRFCVCLRLSACVAIIYMQLPRPSRQWSML